MNRMRVYHENSSSSGVSFCGLLQIAFVVLKLCNVIKWNWWWVFAPTWIPLGVLLLVLIIVLIWPVKK